MICIDVEHRRFSWILAKHHIKTVMITNVLTTSRKVLASVIFTLSTQCYTKGSHNKGEP
jgi:hypothetical protein